MSLQVTALDTRAQLHARDVQPPADAADGRRPNAEAESKPGRYTVNKFAGFGVIACS
jgi:hypothetical protein